MSAVEAGSQPETQPADRPTHGGDLVLNVARGFGITTMWTLSGAHVFPMYDAAVRSADPMPIIDVRHEQSAVFAAEATGKLTRSPGLAVLTAGPGVTNGISAVTQARFSGVPLLVVGGRAPNYRWGTGSLQEIDHVPLLAPITKSAATAHSAADIVPVVDGALRAAVSRHRGPAFVDIPMDEFFSNRAEPAPPPYSGSTAAADPDDLNEIAELLVSADRPVLVLGSDVWMDRAEVSALAFAEETGIPVIPNGMGRGILPRGHRLLVTKARSVALGQADLVMVVGAPLDFRLGFGTFGGKEGAPPAKVVHLADSPDQVAAHVPLAASATGDLTSVLDGLLTAVQEQLRRPDYGDWLDRLRTAASAVADREREMLAADSDPIHPARIYGELLPLLADDAVVIGDGGDFVSWAGKFVEPERPGCWLDPGPFGCLGAGLGAAAAARVARPGSPVVLLLGDGAAGMSLMEVDTLVRHRLPVVMIVGNNGAWGLEKHPMRFLYGYDVAADLRAETRYDGVVEALGGAGETVTRPDGIGPALRRAFAAGTPYLVNIITDPEIPYPRSTTGV